MRRLHKAFALLIVLGGAGAAAALYLTRPQTFSPDAMANLQGDAVRGEQVFRAGGCASCHMAPDATNAGLAVDMPGGIAFASEFGTFYAPNISSDPEHGIGGWSALDLANAMVRGVGRSGEHLYPAFPYASYRNTTLQDVADLHAYLVTLPADPTPSRAHEVSFPFNLRATLGFWKLMFVNEDWVVTGDLTEVEERGRYLVEGLGHCAECHTPRNQLGGMQRDAWLAGAPSASGEGVVPALTPDKLQWSELDIAYYLRSGSTPDYDSVGGEMVEVVENFSHLSNEDRNAVAAYLKRVPASN
ncbi:cytochrome c [Phaeovulum sp.]|uniref:cytochrome c n=1 Tax=Phaeovulum sp. TaxID=2934796 RepID=UPI0035648DDA